VVHFDGEPSDRVHPGIETITRATWTAEVAPTVAPLDVTIHLTPTDSKHGVKWELVFSSRQLGTPLAVGVYEAAERWPFVTAGHAGIGIGGAGTTATGSSAASRSMISSHERRAPVVPCHLRAAFALGEVPDLRGCVCFQQ